MKNRKIAANYILLPDFPLTKNGYAVLEDDNIVSVVDTGGVIREMQGLEFYGGILVSAVLCGMDLKSCGTSNLTSTIQKAYARLPQGNGVAILRGADLTRLASKEDMVITKI